jgi:hypothetical protein
VNGVGAFVTTFGPGELSAYCAVAGQFAEYVSSTLISNLSLTNDASGACCPHNWLPLNRSHEEQNYNAPQFRQWRVWVSMFYNLFLRRDLISPTQDVP